MTSVSRSDLEIALSSKGFQVRQGDHRYYRLFYKGNPTKIVTKISQGSKHREYGDSLLSMVSKQLQFDKKQDLLKFIECSISYEKYIEILIQKNILEK